MPIMLLSAALLLSPHKALADTPISCGQIVSDSISVVGEQDLYTFTADAGDAVRVRVIKTSGSWSIKMDLALYDSTGTRIAFTSGERTHIDHTFTEGGTYTVVVSESLNDQLVDYNVGWHRVNNPCNAAATTCGQSVAGAISVVGEQDLYTFTADAGDIITFGAVEGSSNVIQPSVEVYDPAGVLVAYVYNTSSHSAKVDHTFTESGTYVAVVSNYKSNYDWDELGDYGFTWQKLNAPCNATAATCGQRVDGSISIVGETDFYTLTATAGDVMVIRATSVSPWTDMNPYLDLYDSAGTLVASGSNGYWGGYAEIERTFTEGGTYLLSVRDYGGGGDNNGVVGDYKLMQEKLNGPCNAAPIACGQTVFDSISVVGEQDFYTFTAEAGDAVTVWMDVIPGAMDSPALTLYDPAGVLVASDNGMNWNATINATLAQGGTYLLVTRDRDNDSVGDYTLKYQKNSDICPEVTVTAPDGGELIEAGSIFTISWTSVAASGIASQDISLSTDGGLTFSIPVATGLDGTVQTYDWTIPVDAITARGRVRVIVNDTAGFSTPDDSDADFVIYEAVTKTPKTYVYDKLNRLIQATYGDGTTVTYTYDESGNRTVLGVSGGGGGGGCKGKKCP